MTAGRMEYIETGVARASMFQKDEFSLAASSHSMWATQAGMNS
jgi:hypothetical protein